MSYRPLLYLNDIEIKEIVAYDDLPSIQDGDNSGRTPSLNIVRDILGRVMSISVSLGVTPRKTGISVLNTLKSSHIKVKFLDTETDSYKTIDCYCIDPQKELLAGFMDYFKSMSFVLNSNERYD